MGDPTRVRDAELSGIFKFPDYLGTPRIFLSRDENRGPHVYNASSFLCNQSARRQRKSRNHLNLDRIREVELG